MRSFRLEIAIIFQRLTHLGMMMITVLLLAGNGVAQAEEGPTVQKRWREVFVTVENHTMPVKALEGHAVGVMEQRGFAFYDGGEVATIHAWLTYESKGQRTDYRGYIVYRFRDGATQTATFEGAGDPVGMQQGKFSFVKGTDRFEGIKGSGTFTAEGFPPKADLYVDAEASYTLPKK